MTGSYHNYRTLDVLVPANDWSSTIEMAVGDGWAATYFPIGWSLASLYLAISTDGITFTQVYDAAGNPLTFHTDALGDTIHDNAFSFVGQFDRILRIKPSAPQTGPLTITMFILPYKIYHALGSGWQPRLPSYRRVPSGAKTVAGARDDEFALSGGKA